MSFGRLSRQLHESYRVISCLHETSTRRVELGAHVDLSTPVVLKRAVGAAREDARPLLATEARIAAGVDSRHMVRILDVVGEDDDRDQPVLVFERARGRTLGQLAESWVSEGAAVALALQALSGLSALHAAGFVHGNLNPGHMIVEESVPMGQLLRVVDLSNAAPVGSMDLEVRPGEFVAPELAYPVRVDPRADVFALGACLYRLLAGSRASLTVGSRLARRPRGDVSLELTRVLTHALSPDPSARYQSAEAMFDDLTRVGPSGRRVHVSATELPAVKAIEAVKPLENPAEKVARATPASRCETPAEGTPSARDALTKIPSALPRDPDATPTVPAPARPREVTSLDSVRKRTSLRPPRSRVAPEQVDSVPSQVVRERAVSGVEVRPRASAPYTYLDDERRSSSPPSLEDTRPLRKRGRS